MTRDACMRTVVFLFLKCVFTVYLPAFLPCGFYELNINMLCMISILVNTILSILGGLVFYQCSASKVSDIPKISSAHYVAEAQFKY